MAKDPLKMMKAAAKQHKETVGPYNPPPKGKKTSGKDGPTDYNLHHSDIEAPYLDELAFWNQFPPTPSPVSKFSDKEILKYEADQYTEPSQEPDTFIATDGPHKGKLVASPRYLSAARRIADLQIANAPKPDKDRVKRGIASVDSEKATGIRVRNTGKPADRRVRAGKLLNVYGDGKTAPCLHCGVMVTKKDMHQDRIYGTKQGGGYSVENVFPSCVTCNTGRRDAGVEGAKPTIKPGQWGSQGVLRPKEPE